MFESLKKMLKSAIGTVEEIEKDFKNFDDANVEPNTETKTVEETRHPDGSVTVKTTTVRKLVVKK